MALGELAAFPNPFLNPKDDTYYWVQDLLLAAAIFCISKPGTKRVAAMVSSQTICSMLNKTAAELLCVLHRSCEHYERVEIKQWE